MASYSTDPALYIYTSLTAGSSHIVTATSRLETILRANRIPFKAKDIAVDEKARMLWGRRAGKDAKGRKRQFPGLVQEGLVLGDIVEIEEWNEYRELKQHIKIYYDETTIPDIDHKYPESQLKKRTVKKSAKKDAAKGAQSTTPASDSSAPPPPPPPPPPPATGTSSKGETEASPEEAKAKAKAKENRPLIVVPSHGSVADEAAQKAKELRLKKARDRVEALKKDDSVQDAGKGIFDAALEVTSLRPSSSKTSLRSQELIDGKVKQEEIKEETPQTEMSIDEILSQGLNKARLKEETLTNGADDAETQEAEAETQEAEAEAEAEAPEHTADKVEATGSQPTEPKTNDDPSERLTLKDEEKGDREASPS